MDLERIWNYWKKIGIENRDSAQLDDFSMKLNVLVTLSYCMMKICASRHHGFVGIGVKS